MTNEKTLREDITRRVVDGRVACKALLELAERRGVPPVTVGRLCDEMAIKITACQLGCFK